MAAWACRADEVRVQTALRVSVPGHGATHGLEVAGERGIAGHDRARTELLEGRRVLTLADQALDHAVVDLR